MWGSQLLSRRSIKYILKPKSCTKCDHVRKGTLEPWILSLRIFSQPPLPSPKKKPALRQGAAHFSLRTSVRGDERLRRCAGRRLGHDRGCNGDAGQEKKQLRPVVHSLTPRLQSTPRRCRIAARKPVTVFTSRPRSRMFVALRQRFGPAARLLRHGPRAPAPPKPR
jgi:hypothetical protein